MLRRTTAMCGATMVAIGLGHGPARGQDDPYETYVKTSRDFQRVRQDKAWALKAWPSWTYMPWTYQWGIGYDEASGRWSLAHGYNGAFLDHASTRVGGVDKLAWIHRFKLRFYNDHTAAKGYLYLKDRGGGRLHRPGLRSVPIDDALVVKLKGIVTERVNKLKGSPYRAAYALDDEISWGSFVKPCFWRLNEDRAAYERWLAEIYGDGNAPKHPGWVSYDTIRGKLKRWSVKDFDCSQICDQLSYNDSVWNNLLGDLVATANAADPATPCGFVGGQQPCAFGGYDYAKAMRKIQFIEAYDYGDSQAVIRSLNPHNALPQVTTHFHRNVRDTIWQTWYYLAQGNRGFIGWVEKWFDGKEPAAWHAAVAPHYLEAGQTIGPLTSGAEWIGDGVAIYYSQASLQMNWILDAESHGGTWMNRFTDATISSGALARKAWANMLRDEGMQFSFLDYATVIQTGVPAEYKVLILPATLALSDAEARRIRQFCEGGGTVIADYMPGLWDQHGRGRTAGGALDEMFGVRHDPNMTAADVFETTLWVEVNQDKHYSFKSYDEYLADNTCIKHDSGFNKAVRAMGVDHGNMAARRTGEAGPAGLGQGTAVLMNLSPVWYNAYRVNGIAPAARREVFMKHVKAAGCRPWVRIADADEQTFGYEIVYWDKGDRTILFLVTNAERRANMLGGGNSVGLKTDTVEIRLKFSRPVKDVRDERAGKELGDGETFTCQWTMNEAVVLSFAGGPPR